MRIGHLEPRTVDAMPETLEDGVLYISEKYRVALHACCCGCGEEVSTPIGPTEFSVRLDEAGRVTVRPSIGNHDFACRSHYFITRGAIEWAGAMSRAQIEQGRSYDRYLKRGASPTGLAALWAWIRKTVRRILGLAGAD